MLLLLQTNKSSYNRPTVDPLIIPEKLKKKNYGVLEPNQIKLDKCIFEMIAAFANSRTAAEKLSGAGRFLKAPVF